MEYKIIIIKGMRDMPNDLKMSQSNSLAGNGIQIGEQNNYYGMSYTDTKNLCQDLIREELNVYKREAALEAKKRNDDLLHSLMEKMKKEKLDDVTVGEEFKNPDMQYTYVDAQKAYIRLGTKELEEELTDLLVSRIKERNRSLLQIALQEAITIVPKLLPKHLDSLALCFHLRYTKDIRINNIDSFTQYLNTEIMPFTNFLNEAKKESFFTHLAYTKAGNVEVTSIDLEQLFAQSYPGLFCSGYKSINENYKFKYPKLFLPCLHDSTQWQINAMDEDGLKKTFEIYPEITETEKKDITQLFKNNIMPNDKVKEYLCEIDSSYTHLFELWNNTSLQRLTLTTIGIVLGAMHSKRVTGANIDMNIWI